MAVVVPIARWRLGGEVDKRLRMEVFGAPLGEGKTYCKWNVNFRSCYNRVAPTMCGLF